MRHTLTALAATAILAMATTACSNEPDHPEHEQAYLDDLREGARAEGSGILGFGNEWNIDFGYGICNDLESGMTPEQVIASLEKADGEETPISKAATPAVTSAQTHLCPDL